VVEALDRRVEIFYGPLEGKRHTSLGLALEDHLRQAGISTSELAKRTSWPRYYLEGLILGLAMPVPALARSFSGVFEPKAAFWHALMKKDRDARIAEAAELAYQGKSPPRMRVPPGRKPQTHPKQEMLKRQHARKASIRRYNERKRRKEAHEKLGVTNE
jgi:hypothetical protein